MIALLHSPTVHLALTGALGGWLTAARIDYRAFTTWQSFHDAVEYDWGTALWRWVQGIGIGVVTGLTSGSLLSVWGLS